MSARRLALVLAVAALLAGNGATGRAANPGANGLLLVASGGRHAMGLSGLDSRTKRQLPFVAYGGDIAGAYSPDGTKIAFMSNVEGDLEIYTVNGDGTGFRQLTKNSWADAYPSWSPDGTRIAFTSNRDGDFDIWVMNADGSDPVNLTNWSPGSDDDPHWSPDGRYIAFATAPFGDWDVWLMTPDGKQQFRVTYDNGYDWFDSWSPDGKSLLIDSNMRRDFDIYRYDIGDLDPFRLDLVVPETVSDDAAVEGPAIWSPDGSQIVLSSNRDGDFELYLMNSVGGEQKQLTHNTIDDVVVDWQSLHDRNPPAARVLPGHAPKGRQISVRYTAGDDSGRASAELIAYKGPRAVAYGRTALSNRRQGAIYTTRLQAPRPLTGAVKVCIQALDPSGNTSPRSCTTLQLR